MDQVKIVDEGQAQGRVRDIYDDIKRTMALPFVSDLFKAYGAFPPFLDAVWSEVKPLVGSPSFEGLADRIRAHALACARQRFFVPDHTWSLESRGVDAALIDRIRQTVELFHQAEPRSLVISTVVRHWLASGAFSSTQILPSPSQRSSHRPGQYGHSSPSCLPFPPEARQVLDEMRDALGVPFVPGELAVLAQWPDYLQLAWDDLKAQVRAAEFRRRVKEIGEIARGGIQDLPPAKLDGGRSRELRLGTQQGFAVHEVADLFGRTFPPMVAVLALLRLGMNAILEHQLLELEAGA